MIFPALLAKFLSAGAVAQAATGATVAVVAFTGVGAVGALPDPVQDTFATVVAEITPLEPPTSEEATEEPTEEVVPEVAPEEAVAEDVETTDETTEVTEDAEARPGGSGQGMGPRRARPSGQSFSAWASKGSKNADVKDWLRARGMNFGNVVSAHGPAARASARRSSRPSVRTSTSRSRLPTEPVTDDVSRT